MTADPKDPLKAAYDAALLAWKQASRNPTTTEANLKALRKHLSEVRASRFKEQDNG